ncbi:MAG: flagellar basal body rod C-terminal domain-containing protein [Alphaproteobacteria bacterium]|jgi:flagellar hook protein FlgE|nr:flagellar basal body rod C-terminal domain-containing protein [Alphaproteobacteria bacterium]
MISAINTALSGLLGASKQVESSAARIATEPTAENLVEDIVDIKVAETSYKANLKVIQVADDLTEELLNSFDRTV